MSDQEIHVRGVIEDLMRSNGFTPETRFYRHTLPEFLEPLDEPGRHRLTANPHPSEAVEDIYAQGHIAMAEAVGAGLAFGEVISDAWEEPERVCVGICLRDVIDQGGRIYPVESVIIERVWYFTLPSGAVEVFEASAPPS